MSNSIKIGLGSVPDVRKLFSYPNNYNEVDFLKQTLKQTVEHYLTSSLVRDGYSDSSVEVTVQNNHVFAEITGSGAEPYSQFLQRYLSVGKLGFQASLELHAQKRWRYNWRFFLPHGLAMTRHYSVQLLHFPPDYVLERDQDYLLAHTTLRWASLLEENGALSNDTPRYQNIIDIAPIAAPSHDGRNLNGIYNLYSDYINGLLDLWVPFAKGKGRPLVAFGSPVRGWLKKIHGIDLEVLTLASMKLRSGTTVPVLAANHPSFIYHAAKRLEDDPKIRERRRVDFIMRIMQQDLIVANWQVEMSSIPAADPVAVLDASKKKWTSADGQRRICELTYTQVFDKSPEEASKLCADLPIPDPRRIASLDQKIESLRNEIGALESAAPESFV